jgi:molybdopterin-guanine dinucleotide biosynthesis protein A
MADLRLPPASPVPYHDDMSPKQPASVMGGLVLAGGASRRMGADKAAADWAGQRAVDRVFDLASGLCAGPVQVCGGDYGLPFVPDPFPGAGPVAGILAGAQALRTAGCTSALILAVDAPTLSAADLKPLLDAADPGAFFETLPLPMVIALDALPAEARADWPLRRLAERAGLASLACTAAVTARARGANTPAEQDALLAGFRGS